MTTPLASMLKKAWSDERSLNAALLEPALRAAYESARAAFPRVSCDEATFVGHLARHLPADDDARLAESLAELRTDELFLCVAAASGQAAAVAELERSYFLPTASAVERLRVDTASTDDVLQQIRTKMLVASADREPEILRFSGRGALLGWLRVVATRAALRTKRKKQERPVDPDASVLDDLRDNGGDPELEQIRLRYASELEEALSWSFEQLRPDQRLLLRMYVIDGLILAELAAVHGVDASTISRWLGAIREQIGKAARRRLTERLRLRQSECDSLVGMLQGNLHLSIARLLDGKPDSRDD